MESTEFGTLMRRWRERTSPAAAGLPEGGRRRAKGLRREELALLAGISSDYLTRLEQGRATSPSAQIVESLARALRLSDSERDLLYRLAGHATPGLDVVPNRIPSSVTRLLDRLAHTPVAVFDATGTLLVANAPYNALMGDTTAWQGVARNALWRNLTSAGSRVVHSPEQHADLIALQIADLRITASRYPADRSVRRLVDRLAADSQAFVELWEAGSVPDRRDLARSKTILHPAVGPISLDCDTLVVAQDDLRIMVYTAEPGTPEAEKLALAIVLGTQSLVG